MICKLIILYERNLVEARGGGRPEASLSRKLSGCRRQLLRFGFTITNLTLNPKRRNQNPKTLN